MKFDQIGSNIHLFMKSINNVKFSIFVGNYPYELTQPLHHMFLILILPIYPFSRIEDPNYAEENDHKNENDSYNSQGIVWLLPKSPTEPLHDDHNDFKP